MAWYDLAQNPEALLSLFPEHHDLDKISLFSVDLYREGPVIRFRFDVNAFPDSPPRRWIKEANRVQITVDFFDVTKLSLSGWSVVNACELAVRRGELRHLVKAKGEHCSIAFESGFFRIGSVSGYVDSDR
jgi:hypothetical protein